MFVNPGESIIDTLSSFILIKSIVVFGIELVVILFSFVALVNRFINVDLPTPFLPIIHICTGPITSNLISGFTHDQ